MARIVYTSVKKIESPKIKKRRAPASLVVSGVLGFVIIILVIVVWASTRNGIGSLADNAGGAVPDQASRGVGSGAAANDAPVQYTDLNPESGGIETVGGESGNPPSLMPTEGQSDASDIVLGVPSADPGGVSSGSTAGGGGFAAGGGGAGSGSSHISAPTGSPGTPSFGSGGEGGGSAGDGSSGGGVVPGGDTPPEDSGSTPPGGSGSGTGDTPPPDEPPAEDPQEESLCVDEQGQIILLQHANSC